MEQSALHRYLYGWLSYPQSMLYEMIDAEEFSEMFARLALIFIMGILGILLIVSMLAISAYVLKYPIGGVVAAGVATYLLIGQAVNYSWKGFFGKRLF